MPKKRKSSETLSLDLKQNERCARRNVDAVQSYFDQETYGRHTALSKATGIPYQTLRRALGNIESLRLHHLMLLARAMKEEPDSLLKKALKDLVEDADKIDADDPAMKLREAHGQQVPIDEFFTDSVRFWRDISPIKLPSKIDRYLDPEVEAIDELREKDRGQALELARKALAIGSDFRDAKQFAAYIGRLGALASVHRVYGRYYLSALILERAMRMLCGRYESALAANLLIRAASVLRDLSRPKDGIPMLRRAQCLLDEHGMPEEATAALYARAAFLEYMGKRDRAMSIIESCLALPAADIIHDSARFQRAVAETDRGNYALARSELESLLQLEHSARWTAKTLWRLAECAGKQNPASGESLSLYDRAFSEARDHLEPADLFFVFFDFSEMLESVGGFQLMSRQATALVPDLGRLGQGTAAWVIARDFLERAAQAHALSIRTTRKIFRQARQQADSQP